MTIDSTGAAQSAAAAGEGAAAAKSGVNREAFLQLLVAQIRHQNPLSPADGVQFLTQLAQFSELEQMLEIRNEIAALRTEMTQQSGAKEDTTSGDKNV